MTTLHDASHPLWPLLRLIVVMVSLSVVLKTFATSFDKTEIYTICFTFLAAAGAEGAPALMNLFRGKSQ